MSPVRTAIRARLTTGLIVVVALCCARSARAGEVGPRLVVSPERVQLGEIYWGASGQGELVLENAGDEVLVVETIKSTCGCTVAPLAAGARRLEPGAKVTVPVIMTPKGPQTPLRKTLHVLTNDRTRPDQPVEVECDVRIGVETVPGYVLFRDLELGDVVETELVVRSGDGTPFTIRSASVNSDLFEVTFDEEAPALRHVLRVEAGPLERRVNPSSLLTITTDHPKTPTISVNCNAMTAPALLTEPRYLVLGDAPAGSEALTTLKVWRPKSAEPFESLSLVPVNIPDLAVRTWRDVDDPAIWHVAVTAPADRVGQTLSTPVRLVTELGDDAAPTLLLALHVTPEKP